MVEILNGRIWVESQKDQGSTFHFTARFDCLDHNPNQEPPPDTPPLHQTQVLVGSASATSRLIIHEMLSAYGAEVTEITEVEALLPALKEAEQAQRPFDLLLLDHPLLLAPACTLATHTAHPGWKGLILALLPTTLQQEDLPACNLVPGMDVINKPVRRGELLRASMRLLGKSSESREAEEGLGLPSGHEALNILLVDNIQTNQLVASEILQRAGHEIMVASTGQEALKFWQQRFFDLILMELQLPDMPGHAVTQQIRQAENSEPETPPIPIIAVTATVLNGEQENCLSNGMTGFLAKPFRAKALLNLVGEFGKRQKPARRPPARNKQPDLLDAAIKPQQVAEQWQIFLTNTPTLITTLRQQITKPDPKAARQIIEQLKKMATNAGALPVKMTATRLATAILGEHWEKADTLMTSLETIHQQTMQAITTASAT